MALPQGRLGYFNCEDGQRRAIFVVPREQTPANGLAPRSEVFQQDPVTGRLRCGRLVGVCMLSNGSKTYYLE